jgi:recombination protein RecA
MAIRKKKKSSLHDKLDTLKNKHGAQHFTDSTNCDEVERIPSGLFSIDYATGGGLPLGKIVEMFGPESSGKTSMAMHFAAQAQAQGKLVCYIDAEIGFNYDFAKQVGLSTDPDKFVLVQPQYGEEALDICLEMLDVENMGVIVVDSIPALVPRAVVEGDVGDAHIGLLARALSQFCPMIVKKLDESKCSIIFINQIREKIGVMFGSPETTPGGRAMKFYSAMRMRVKKRKFIEKEGEPIGMRAEMHVVKNKTAPPFRKAEYELFFGTGFSKESDLVENALARGIFTKKGSWLFYNKTDKEQIQLGQGALAVGKLLEDNPEMFKEIWDKVEDKA